MNKHEQISRANSVAGVAMVAASAMNEGWTREKALSEVNKTFASALSLTEAMGVTPGEDRVNTILDTIEKAFDLAWPVEVQD